MSTNESYESSNNQIADAFTGITQSPQKPTSALVCTNAEEVYPKEALLLREGLTANEDGTPCLPQDWNPQSCPYVWRVEAGWTVVENSDTSRPQTRFRLTADGLLEWQSLFYRQETEEVICRTYTLSFSSAPDGEARERGVYVGDDRFFTGWLDESRTSGYLLAEVNCYLEEPYRYFFRVHFLYFTEDGGATWTGADTLPPATQKYGAGNVGQFCMLTRQAGCIFGIGADRAYDTGELHFWLTTDGGVTWSEECYELPSVYGFLSESPRLVSLTYGGGTWTVICSLKPYYDTQPLPSELTLLVSENGAPVLVTTLPSPLPQSGK